MPGPGSGGRRALPVLAAPDFFVSVPARAGWRWQSRCHVSSVFRLSLIMDLVSHPRRVPGLYTKKGPYSAVLSQTGSPLVVAVLASLSGIRWICPQINRTQDGFLKGVMVIHCVKKNLSRGRR